VVVVADGRSPPDELLAAVRRENVRVISALVLTRSSASAAHSIQSVLDRIPSRAVFAPANHQVGAAIAVEMPVDVTAGPFTIALAPDRTASGLRRLTVRIGSTHAVRARPA
jgi:hypothetical protein